MRVCVVGSEGYVGKNLCTALIKNQVEVSKLSSKFGNGLNRQTGLFPDEFEFPEGTEAIVYLSQSPEYNKDFPKPMNIYGEFLSALKAYEIAQKQNIRRFIYTSSGSVYEKSFETLNESSKVQARLLFTK